MKTTEIGYKYYYFWKRLEAFCSLKKGNIKKFLQGEKIAKTIEKLHSASYEKIGTLSCEAFVTEEPLPFGKRTEGKREVLTEGSIWAKNVFDCAWFHITGKTDRLGKSIKYVVDCGGEGLVFDKKGKVVQGLTSRCSSFSPELGMPRKIYVDSEGVTEADGSIDFWVDCGANDLFGKRKNDSKVGALQIAEFHDSLNALAYDMEVLLDIYAYNYTDEYTEEIMNALRTISDNCGEINDAQAEIFRDSLKPLLARQNDKHAFSFCAIGHAHLDLAWLWPIRESRRKGGRTFSNQLKNIRDFDGYIFGASQAQLYQWVKEDYPDVFEEVKKAVADGRWDVQGATWVEPDSFLISGESLIRQFYYGKKYFQEQFGKDMKIFWVPDSFGYSACLPQVMKLAEVPYFLTQKMSWNKENKFPYHTFLWEGLDGSKVLAHMLPECTYNGAANTVNYKKAEKYYYERRHNKEAMSLFGIGDGGAGPGAEHIERINRMENLRGTPKVKYGLSEDFFNQLATRDGYPQHSGELYLERHQGTQTSHARNKRFNRKCEIALRNYELLSSFATQKGLDLPLKKEQIDEIWKEILLYQFHDILPGSSIDRVYTESEARYAVVSERLEKAIKELTEKMCSGQSVLNLNPYSYTVPCKIGEKWVVVNAPSMGSVNISDCKESDGSSLFAGGKTIENEFLRVTFDGGYISSLYDKKLEKEFCPRGRKMGVISKYIDLGDAWDFPKSYREKKTDVRCETFRLGKDGAEVYAEARYSLGSTVIEQRFSLLKGARQVNVHMTMDVHQKSSMLRIAFPVDVYTSECAFNVQFGHLFRRTTNENSIEKAQFEVNGQKFIDMSECEYGVSILNDCKYGYSCKGNVMDINLVRTPQRGPSKQPDQGKHEVNYAVLVHDGPLGAETYKQAYLLNNPLKLIDGTGEAVDFGYTCDNENVIVEAIKPADDGNGFVARIYNTTEKEQVANMAFGGRKAVERTDIFEKRLSEATMPLVLHKFELALIRFA